MYSILKLTLPFILIAGCESVSNQNGNENVKATPDTTQHIAEISVENQIIDSIFELPEIKARATLIEEKNHGNRHLKIWIADKPDLPDQPYYWIKAGEDNGSTLVTHFHFYVYPDPMKILHFDPLTDSAITLQSWRKLLAK